MYNNLINYWNKSDAIALVEGGGTVAPEHARLLSAPERATYQAIAHEERQGEWLSSRLLAKYLCLTNIGSLGAPNGNPINRPVTPEKLTTDKLKKYPAWAFRNVRLNATSNYHEITWCNQVMRYNYSASHKEGVASVCLSQGKEIGIDLEKVQERKATFYRYNFTDNEKQWVEAAVGGANTPRDWLYTLLWTVKESYFKSGKSDCTTVLDFPTIDVSIVSSPGQINYISKSQHQFGEFSFLPVTIAEKEKNTQVHIAISANNKMVLTALKI